MASRPRTASTRCSIPNGTVIPAGGHYLCVNSVGYSLAAIPQVTARRRPATRPIRPTFPTTPGIALFNNNTGVSYSLANRLDAVGSGGSEASWASAPSISAARSRTTPAGSVTQLPLPGHRSRHVPRRVGLRRSAPENVHLAGRSGRSGAVRKRHVDRHGAGNDARTAAVAVQRRRLQQLGWASGRSRSPHRSPTAPASTSGSCSEFSKRDSSGSISISRPCRSTGRASRVLAEARAWSSAPGIPPDDALVPALGKEVGTPPVAGPGKPAVRVAHDRAVGSIDNAHHIAAALGDEYTVSPLYS